LDKIVVFIKGKSYNKEKYRRKRKKHEIYADDDKTGIFKL